MRGTRGRRRSHHRRREDYRDDGHEASCELETHDGVGRRVASTRSDKHGRTRSVASLSSVEKVSSEKPGRNGVTSRDTQHNRGRHLSGLTPACLTASTRSRGPMDERAALLGGRNAGRVSGDRPVRVSIAPEVVPDKAHCDLGGDGGQGGHQRTSPWVRALLLVGLVALVVTCAALTRAEISSRHVATPRLVSPGFDQLTADVTTAALEKKHIPTEEVAHAGKTVETQAGRRRRLPLRRRGVGVRLRTVGRRPPAVIHRHIEHLGTTRL